MNRAYRLVWNLRTLSWSVAPETATGRGKNGTRSLLVGAALLLAGAGAGALPQGGQVSAGSGSIATPNASTLNVQQTSSRLAINWQSFGIGNGETVNFAQPGASAIALNRVLGTDGSAILGRLNANGQVFLINPNGVLFGAGAQVNVGGLVASTLNLSDNDFMAGRYTFGSTGATGAASVVNLGNVTAADGGYVALLGGQVSNQGAVQARLGTVALASGNQITLDFAGDGLLSVQVDKGAIGALAENKSLIQADGGQVFMSAKAADSLVQAVVNNTGVIEARTLENRGGRIVLLADMANGTAQVGGTLDASAPNGGNGGFIETSGANVQIADSARITTAAAAGQTGTWLIDPNDFTVAASGGNITGTALSTQLASNNVTIQTATQGTAGGNGDILVNQAVSWSAGTKLTLEAERNIKVSSDITVSGNNAGLALKTGAAGKFTVEDPTSSGVLAKITLSGGNPSFSVNGNAYTVVQSLAQLQSINGSNLAGYYALGTDIDASSTAALNGGAGFKQLGTTSTGFTGTFDGLGHAINGLTINRPSENSVGLFGTIGTGGMVRQVLLVSPKVTGKTDVGSVAGVNKGTIERAFVYGSDNLGSARVSGVTNVGGVAGNVSGTVSLGTLARVFVNGTDTIGGLVGYLGEGGLVTDASSARVISGETNVGGLVGYAYKSTILNSRYQGTLVSGTSNVGGVVGAIKDGTIDSVRTIASTTAGVTTQGEVVGQQGVGGIVGDASGSAISRVTSNDSVTGMLITGGLVGSLHDGSTLSNGTSNGKVTAESTAYVHSVGGAVGSAADSTIAHVTANGAVSVASASSPVWAWSIGGFIGSGSNVSIDDAVATGNVAATTAYSQSTGFGGFAGNYSGSISNARASGSVTIDGPGAVQSVGGFVGMMSGSLDHVTANGSVDTSGSGGANYVGGLVGQANTSTITNYAVNGNVKVSGGSYVGGVAGLIDHGSIDGATVARSLVATSDVYYVGGFAGAINYASVSGVHLTGTVTVGTSSQYVGGLAGSLNYASVSNSSATADVVGTSYVGGLVGQSTASTISGSTASGDVVAAYAYAGGLVGDMRSGYTATTDPQTGATVYAGAPGQVLGSSASGDVRGNVFVGGLVGQTGGTNYSDGVQTHAVQAVISDSHATGNVSANTFYTTSSSVGGLVGSASMTALSNVSATGSVTAGDQGYDVGGLVGSLDGSLTGGSASGSVVAGSNSVHIGGLIGYGTGVQIVDIDPANTVTVGANSYNVGGVAGSLVNGSLSNVHATGDLVTGEGSHHVGGLVGQLSTSRIDGSSATADISGGGTLGGLVGQASSSVVSKSIASGNVTATGSTAGGLVGEMSSSYTATYNDATKTYTVVGAPSQILDSSASGAVAGGYAYTGGLVGNINGTTFSDGVTTTEIQALVSGSSATGAVSGNYAVGGIAGNATHARIVDTTTTGAVGGSNSTNSIGGAVGYASSVELQNVSANGAVVAGNSGSYVGGLVGFATNVSLDTYSASSSVTSGTSSYQVGGLVGYANGMSVAGYASTTSVTVGDNSTDVGGLAGRFENGSIDAAHASGTVSVGAGTSHVGGLVGSLVASTVSNSSSTADVHGASYVGGLVGSASDVTISDSSSSGNIVQTDGSFAGGLVGQIQGTSVYTWNATTQQYEYITRNSEIVRSAATGNVTGNSNIGGLVGDASDATLSHVAASGKVTASSNAGYVGGLVGSLRGSLADGSATGQVVAGDNAAYVGGLIGSATGTQIQDLTVSNNVTVGAASNYVGGVVGSVDNGSIARVDARNVVTTGEGTNYVGGIAGRATYSDISASSATSDIEGSRVLGGLVGQLQYGTVSNSTASGNVTGTADIVGGLVGEVSSTYNNVYVPATASYTTVGVAGRIVDSSASGQVSGSSNVGGLVGTVSGMSYWDGSTLREVSAVVSGSHATGNVSAASTLGGLAGTATSVAIGNSSASGDVTGSSSMGGLIGNASSVALTGVSSTGAVTAGDGAYAVGGLVGSGSNVSLDTYTASASVTTGQSSNYVGGLAGMASGMSIDGYTAAGSVTVGDNSSYVGGLVGQLTNGTINEAHLTGTVSTGTNATYVGGFVGWMTDSSVAHSSATSGIQGGSYVGGLVGYGSSITISDSIATGHVTGTGSYVGGLAGSAISSGVVTDPDTGLSTPRISQILRSTASGDVTGTSQVGGLVGNLSGQFDYSGPVVGVARAVVDGSTATGHVTGQSSVGGLVGSSGQATISNSSAHGDVTVSNVPSSVSGVGGLLGDGQEVRVLGSTATGNVSATGDQLYGGSSVGGLSGTLTNSSVTDSSASGSVTAGYGISAVGGLVGDANGVAVSGYQASSNVTVGDNSSSVGGLAGRFSNGSIADTHATGKVTAGVGTSNVGGLVGTLTGSTVSNSSATANIGGASNLGGLIGQADYSTISGSTASGNVAGEGSNIGGLVGNITSNYGTSYDASTNTYTYFGSPGKVLNSTASGAVSGAGNVGGLVGQISGVTYYDSIRDVYVNSLAVVADSHATGNVNAGATTYSSTVGGLVGTAYLTAVSDATATGSVTGTYAVGGLIGSQQMGHTERSYATGDVVGSSAVGGLIGTLSGATLDQTWAAGSVTGLSNVGGLVGTALEQQVWNSAGTAMVAGGRITQSYASGAVTGATDGSGSATLAIGGLVGESTLAIDHSYASGKVSTTDVNESTGGLVGIQRENGQVLSSYWNADSTGQFNGIGRADNIETVSNTLTGLTQAMSLNAASYTGWDLTGAWRIYDGYTAPLLRTFMTALVVTVDDARKTYDGTLWSGGNGLSYSIAGASLLGTPVYGGSAQGARNAGSYTLDVSGLYSTQLGYDVTQIVKGTLTVDKRQLVLAATAQDKVYDATTAVAYGHSDDRVAGDQLSIATTAAFDNKNVGVNKLVTVSVQTVTGADAQNYIVDATYTTHADVTPKAIAGAIVADNKVYDATTSATTHGSLTGVFANDQVTLATSGSFDNKNAGLQKTVTVSGALVGGDATNYTVSSNATTTADITPKGITGTIVADNKVYDGGVSATTHGSLNGVISGDTVALNSSGTFADKNAAVGKTVTVAGTLTGTDAGNYAVTNNATTTATIDRKAIEGAIVAAGKTYDGTVAASTSGSLNGVVTDDVVTLSTAGTFAEKNAGTARLVNVNGTLAGKDAGNYTVSSNATTTADIDRKLIAGTIAAQNKTYDGTVAAITSGTLSDVVSGDKVALDSTGTFGDKNAGSGKIVTVSGALSGADAANYIVQANATTTADIAQRALTGTIVAQGKTYDRSTDATTSGSLANTVAGDDISLNTQGSFTDWNAGLGKVVNVSGTLGGKDAGNYTVTSNATATADIARRVLAFTDITADSKVYDASRTATVSATLSGVLEGDKVTAVATGDFSDKNVGTGKTVAITGSLGGADASNYVASTTTTATADITARAITGTIVAAGKVYDGNATAATTGSLDGVLINDGVTLSTTGSFSDKNAGLAKTVNVAGALTGVDAGNYTVSSNATTQADIAQKAITGVIVATGKTYDGTTGASTSGTLQGAIANDLVSLTTTGEFSDKNAGLGKTVNVAGVLAGKDAGNYIVDSNATTTADIARRLLAFTDVVAGNKVYDATKTATVSAALDGVIGKDDVSVVVSGSFGDKNVGTAKVVTLAGSLGGADAGNYLTSTTTTTTADITAKAISGAITAANKTYDGTVAAVTAGSLDGVIAGDGVVLTTSGSFSDKNAASGKTVNVSGALGGVDAANYVLGTNATTTADILQRAITGAIVANNKTYDGTIAATTSGTLNGTIDGDSIGLSTSGQFADKNAAVGKTVTVSGSLTGADAKNYVVTNNGTTTATIDRRAITGAIVADSKIYDGTAAATTGGTLSGTIGGDDIGLATSGSFSDKNAAAGKTVTVTGTLAGADAGNYTVTNNATTTADIAKKAITGAIVADNKTYDGSIAASTSGSLSGAIEGDIIGLSTTGSFSDKNAALGKTVTVTGALAGADAGNYTVTSNATTTADILQRAITGAIVAANKTYDGTVGVNTSGSLSGTVVGDDIALATSGSFGDKNVATGKTVTVNGALTGTDAGNYVVSSNATTKADILKKAITGAIVADSKIYDGTAVAATSGTLSDTVSGDDIGLATSGSFSDKNAAVGKTVTVTGALTGTDAGNYTVTNNVTTTADIAKRAITGAIVADNKVYDGTIAASTSGSLNGAIGGDDIGLSTTGSFSDKNAAAGKTVTVAGTLAGADAGNYTVTSNATTTADIAKRAINGAIVADNKVYDGTVSAATHGSLSGTVGGDDIALTTSGSFSDKNAATGKTVTVAGTLAGTDAGNYTVTNNATTTADIAKRAITGAILADSKVYDGTTVATTSGTLSGTVGGDDIGVSTTGNFSDKNAAAAKTVTVAGTLIGADAGNYTVTNNATTTADITQKAIGGTIVAADKTYDGNRVATTTGSLNGTVVGDDIALATSGTFSDKNAAAGKTVTVAGALTGTDAGNYAVTSNATTTADIAQRAITGTIVAANKVYDGNTTASTTGSLGGTVAGDDIALATSGSFGDKNAAVGKTVTVNGTLIGADAGNYLVSSNASAKADILQKAITGAIVANNKTYDGTIAATTSGSLSGTVGGDDIGLSTTGNFSDKNAAVGKTVTVGGTLTGVDAGNYTVTSNATTTADIAKKAITGAIVADSKIYDGTIAATTTGTLADTVAGDVIGLSTTGSFSDKNAAVGKTVTVTGALTGTDAGNYTVTSNATTTADIAKKAITGAIVASNKIYDGTIAATTTGTLNGAIVGDAIGLATTGSFSDKNAATGKTVTVTGALSGADAGNYTVTSNATTTADIAKKAIAGAIVADSKIYDGTTAAATSGTLTNTIAGDVIGLATTGSFSDKNAAAGKTVTVAGTLTGTDAGNYTVTSNATTTADIAKKAITGAIVANNKTYDGTIAATTTGTLSGAIVGDAIGLATTGNFSDKNAATGKTVTVTGALSGTDAGNYTVTSNATTTADITKKAITGAIVAANKTYDGTITATTTGTLSGAIVGDAIGLATTGSFSDKNAATGKTVAVAGTLAGADAGNYTVISNTTTTADIAKKAITGAIVAGNKTYDGTIAATTSGTLNGAIVGDAIGLATTGSFSDKNAATGKTVTVSGTLTGTDAGNYAVTSNATTTADIAKRAISGAIVAADKVYDGTTVAITSGSLSGAVSGDVVSLATTGSFANKNAATGKTVTVSGALSGTDAGNYTVTSNATTTASITPKAVTGAITAADKVYDGTVAATTSGSLSGTIAGDAISLATSGSFANKNAATGKTVTVAGTLAGADAGNYTVTSNTTTTADIARKALSYATLNAADKVYDGTTAATVSASLGGVVSGDTVSLAATGSFADGNAGTAKAVGVTGTLAGADAANYTLAAASTTAAIAAKALTVTANDASKTFDGTAYQGGNGVTVTGLVAGDTAAGLGTVSYGGSAQGAVQPGNYVLTAGGLRNTNYAISYAAGKLSIDGVSFAVDELFLEARSGALAQVIDRLQVIKQACTADNCWRAEYDAVLDRLMEQARQLAPQQVSALR